jgi:hypothetical protein
MSIGRIKERLVAAVVATVMAPALAFGAAFTGDVSEAEAAEKAECQVHAVLASKEGDGKIPKNLEFLRKTLEADEFAWAKSFHLLDKKEFKLKVDKPKEATFKTGHAMRLTLLGAGEEGKLQYHFSLSGRDGTKPLVDADYSIERHGQILTGVGTYTEGDLAGKLFFAIQCG